MLLIVLVFLGIAPPRNAAASPPTTAPTVRHPAGFASAQDDPDHATIKVPIEGRDQTVRVFRSPGGLRYEAPGKDGPAVLTPEEFAKLLYGHRGKSWFFRALNISTWGSFFWVLFGLLGQLVFTSRMILQWLVSEKKGKSVVPVGFWWGSLIGGAMLLTYFIWRKDIVGILGQATGALIYARNLWLIYTRPRDEASAGAG